jgi:hypothetical protein
LEMSPNLHTLKSSPFRNLGKGGKLPSNSNYRKRNTGFKHIK